MNVCRDPYLDKSSFTQESVRHNPELHKRVSRNLDQEFFPLQSGTARAQVFRQPRVKGMCSSQSEATEVVVRRIPKIGTTVAAIRTSRYTCSIGNLKGSAIRNRRVHIHRLVWQSERSVVVTIRATCVRCNPKLGISIAKIRNRRSLVSWAIWN
jgi:hypothetical protein